MKKVSDEYKQLTFDLLTGREYYLMSRTMTNGVKAYMLYKENAVPVKYFSVSAVNKFRKVLRVDDKTRLRINLSLVRQLHGRSHIKKTYKILQTKI